jgi:hypothetical protein
VALPVRCVVAHQLVASIVTALLVAAADGAFAGIALCEKPWRATGVRPCFVEQTGDRFGLTGVIAGKSA